MSEINHENGSAPIHTTPAEYLLFSGAQVQPEPATAMAAARLLNAASTPFPVNLSLDRAPRIAGSIFSSLTAYTPVPAGAHRVTVNQGDATNALLLDKELSFPPNSRSTAVLVDSSGQGIDLFQVADQPCQAGQSGQACLRTANMSMEGSSFALHATDGTLLHEHIPFGGVTPYRTLPAGPYGFYVTEDSELEWLSGPIAASSLTLMPGGNYTLYLLGNSWSPYGFRILPVRDS